MAQQIPLTFSEVLNLPSLGVSANAIKFGARDPSHARNMFHAPSLKRCPARAAAARAAPERHRLAVKRARAREPPLPAAAAVARGFACRAAREEELPRAAV